MSGERGFLMLVEWDDLREKGIFLQFQMIQVNKKNHMMKLSNQRILRYEVVMRKSRSVAVGCLASGWVFVDIFSHTGMDLRHYHHGKT